MKHNNLLLLLALPLLSACSPTEMITSVFDNLGGSWFGVVIGFILLIVAVGLIIDSFSGGVDGDGFARFFGIVLLIGGGIALVAAGPWGGSNDDNEMESSESVKPHNTSDDDDYESSPSSSSSSGASSNDGMWSQPQPQSWGGGYSQPQYDNESNYQSHSTSSNEGSGSNLEYYTERKHCYRCNGTGTYDCPCVNSLKFGLDGNTHRCSNCGELHNSAYYHSCKCRACDGKGYTEETRVRHK